GDARADDPQDRLLACEEEQAEGHTERDGPAGCRLTTREEPDELTRGPHRETGQERLGSHDREGLVVDGGHAEETEGRRFEKRAPRAHEITEPEEAEREQEGEQDVEKLGGLGHGLK